jgi:hypothetical protein
MAHSRRGTIVVELELDDQDALAGTVAVGGGEAMPFSGWIGLFAALEGTVDVLREGERDPRADTPMGYTRDHS